jgi:serine O-acetyltransferase
MTALPHKHRSDPEEGSPLSRDPGVGAAGVGAGAGAIVDAGLVDRVAASILGESRTRHLGSTHLPRREAVGELVEVIRELCFPGFFGRRGLTEQSLPLHVQQLLTRVAVLAEDQIRSVVRYAHDIGPERSECEESREADCRAREIARGFLEWIPEMRRLLALDVQAAYDGDPAAQHPDETIFCYPGIDAVFSHRVAWRLHTMGVPLLPRIIQEMAHTRTGIDIHPGARVGESFFIDHGGGVVIGETTEIGDHVRIYQGVTLGAKNFEMDDRGRVLRGRKKKRHPTIGNRVTIYAGAVILGGDTVIGDDCVISGSVYVTESVPAGHLVRQTRAELVVRSHADRASGGRGPRPGDGGG